MKKFLYLLLCFLFASASFVQSQNSTEKVGLGKIITSPGGSQLIEKVEANGNPLIMCKSDQGHLKPAASFRFKRTRAALVPARANIGTARV